MMEERGKDAFGSSWRVGRPFVMWVAVGVGRSRGARIQGALVWERNRTRKVGRCTYSRENHRTRHEEWRSLMSKPLYVLASGVVTISRYRQGMGDRTKSDVENG